MSHEPTADRRCAYYLRVSQPSQKIEHQRSAVLRYCDSKSIVIPQALRYEDKGGRRQYAEKRESFQRLLAECRGGKIDWVLIAAFDRWGVKNEDEFFVFRHELKSLGVKLWSVQDELDLTGAEEHHIWRIVGKATAATASMRTHADRNIGKMIDMALNGWHASGNHPYGTDLLCCRTADRKPLYRLHLLHNVSRTNRTYKVFHLKDDGVTVDREETVKRMPPRNSKETGYRLAWSLDESRIEAVRQIFQLGNEGLGPGPIADVLYSQGILHFGKAFGANGVDTIMRNRAYIGLPEWGKVGVGYYKQALEGRASAPPERRPNEPLSRRKAKDDRIVAKEPVFEPMVDPVEFEKLQVRLAAKPTKSKPRRRDRRIHPLNGLVFCPDCGSPMVNTQATNRQDETVYYFTCGKYARTRHKECRANSVAHSVLDKAATEVLARVEKSLRVEPSKAIRGLESRMGVTWSPYAKAFLEMAKSLPKRLTKVRLPENSADIPATVQEWEQAVIAAYEAGEAKRTKAARKRLGAIEAEILNLGEAILGTKAPTLRAKWNADVERLEEEKAKLQEGMTSALDRYRALHAERDTLLRRMMDLRQNRQAELWEQFVGRVVPTMHVQTMRNGKERTKVVGFRFEPRKTSSDHVGSVLEIECNRRGRGSAPRPA